MSFEDKLDNILYCFLGNVDYIGSEKARLLRPFTFRAYGMGAPRAHNRIILLEDQAKINGRRVNIDGFRRRIRQLLC